MNTLRLYDEHAVVCGTRIRLVCWKDWCSSLIGKGYYLTFGERGKYHSQQKSIPQVEWTRQSSR